MFFQRVERPPAPPRPVRSGKLAGARVGWGGVFCPPPGPGWKVRARAPARGRGLVCFASRCPGIGVGPRAPLGPRLWPFRAQRLEDGQVQQKVFHWKEKVTRGRDRESRGRGLTIPVARRWPRSLCPGATLFQAAVSLGPCMGWPLKSIWVPWPGASQGIWWRNLAGRAWARQTLPHPLPRCPPPTVGLGSQVWSTHSPGVRVLPGPPAPPAVAQRWVCTGMAFSTHRHFRQARPVLFTAH